MYELCVIVVRDFNKLQVRGMHLMGLPDQARALLVRALPAKARLA